ncbi:amidohydrolase family protein [Candidatus Magnetomorum sp. HK-1]|nr:amidohydrolase family protein [Candidatus Magnetomorum sp. HK-1]
MNYLNILEKLLYVQKVNAIRLLTDENTFQYIHAGHFIDGAGTIIQKDVVLKVQNHKLVSIDPINPDLYKKITHDFSKKILCPPLVDAHVHLAMSGTKDTLYRQAQLKMDFNQAKLLISDHLNDCYTSGIFEVRDGGDHFGHTNYYKHNIEHEVHIHSACNAWFRKGRYGKFVGKEILPDENCLIKIKNNSKTDHIKIILSGINSIKIFGKETKPQFSQEEMQIICQWALKNQKPVMVHANGEKPVQIAINAGCTSVEHGYFMGKENLKKMADKQIYWTPTLIPMFKLSKYLNNQEEKDIAKRTFDHQCEQLTQAKKFGVPIIVGSDAGSFGVNHEKGFFEEIRLIMECGYSLAKVIQSCTSQSMKLLKSQFSGILQKGEPARFIVLEKEKLNLGF